MIDQQAQLVSRHLRACREYFCQRDNTETRHLICHQNCHPKDQVKK